MRLLNKHLRRFRDDEEATITVEFVIMFPLLLTLLAFGFEFFDAYKSYSRASKASYALSDYVSRQDAIDDEYVERVHKILDGLLPWISADESLQKSVRVTSLRYSGSSYSVLNSYVSPGSEYMELTTDGLSAELIAKLPDIAANDTVMLIETKVPHRPLIDVMKMSNIVWENQIAIRPRYHREIVHGRPGSVATSAGYSSASSAYGGNSGTSDIN